MVPVSVFHYDVKMLLFRFLILQRTELSNYFDTIVAQPHGTVLLVNHLKTSSMDSVIIYI